MTQLYVLTVNPEPWAIGPLQTGRKNGKAFPIVGRNAQLHAFQEAVREAFASDYPDAVKYDGPVELKFYFWRRRDDYATGSGRRHRKHQADLTNLQKGLEDALQGVLFENDENVTKVTSTIMHQGANTTPTIVIEIGVGQEIADVPPLVQHAVINKRAALAEAERIASDNSWGG